VAAARRVGLRAAGAFPIRSQGVIVAVAVFFSRQFRPPDAELIDLITDVATRIGLFIEYRRIQEQVERQREALYQQEKLAALGTLAAGLAHEINNPIGVIGTRIELMLGEDPGPPAGLREDLEVVQRHIRRVGQIASGLLSFARRPTGERAPLDLRQVVKETLLLVEAQMRRAGIEIRTSFEGAAAPILGDANALQQVMLNLLTNAREAIGGPGTVTIDTRPAPRQPGWIQLVIGDSGPGIPRDVLPRIFDPFFTTKAQGTGLGLPLSYGIVQDHGGTIRADSQPGRGATFTLSFPLIGPPA
jgi:two-component system NtrC family sensor kinase